MKRRSFSIAVCEDDPSEKEEWDTALSNDEPEKALSGQGFIRCHQSFLVNCRYIHVLRTAHAELTVV